MSPTTELPTFCVPVISFMSDKNRTPYTATALLLVKGAIAKVMGLTLTVGNKYESPTKGMIVSPPRSYL